MKANQVMSDTGMSAKKTCVRLSSTINNNDMASKLYSKHSQDLKLDTDKVLKTESLYGKSYNFVSTRALGPNDDILAGGTGVGALFGRTKIDVERAVHVAYRNYTYAQVFTVLSHIVRACGYIPEQPLQCLEVKRSKCVWSYVNSPFQDIKSGEKLPKEIKSRRSRSVDKEHQDQLCGPDTFLELTTSRKL